MAGPGLGQGLTAWSLAGD